VAGAGEFALAEAVAGIEHDEPEAVASAGEAAAESAEAPEGETAEAPAEA
jgi:hypothetical protein